MNKIKDIAEHRLFHAIVGALLFVIAANAITNLYYRYFDNREYYRLELPVSVVEKEYQPCDEVVLTGKVYSGVVVKALAQRELVLVHVDETEETLDAIEEDVNLNTTPLEGVFFRRRVKLPCSVKPGFYYYRGRVDYEVRDINKHYEYFTETFEVVE